MAVRCLLSENLWGLQYKGQVQARWLIRLVTAQTQNIQVPLTLGQNTLLIMISDFFHLGVYRIVNEIIDFNLIFFLL